MGKGSNPLAPMNKLVGTLDPTSRNVNKAVKEYTGIDPTRKDEGLKKQEPITMYYGDSGASSRTTISSGTIKKIYNKEDTKR